MRKNIKIYLIEDHQNTTKINHINPRRAQQISKLHNYSRPVFTSHNHVSLPFLYTLYHTGTIFEKEMCVVVLCTTFSESLHVIARN
jgi:hypothetical protein